MYQGAEKDGVYEKKMDARVTKVGRIIRKTSMDELPQLINILKGEMSFIGPRPVLIQHPWKLREYTDEQLKRFWVKPGVSGLAQIHGRKNLSWEQRMKYDVQYVFDFSLQLDIKIFFITIYKVFTMQDNYNKDQTVSKKLKNPK
jgi:lipopolysaccharide/colanic/teichoic acid biosynthesis glycosyltransferase